MAYLFKKNFVHFPPLQYLPDLHVPYEVVQPEGVLQI